MNSVVWIFFFIKKEVTELKREKRSLAVMRKSLWLCVSRIAEPHGDCRRAAVFLSHNSVKYSKAPALHFSCVMPLARQKFVHWLSPLLLKSAPVTCLPLSSGSCRFREAPIWHVETLRARAKRDIGQRRGRKTPGLGSAAFPVLCSPPPPSL